MYEITYLVFIKYRGPFGITMTLPKLRTCHAGRQLPALRPFQLEEILLLPCSRESNTEQPDC